MASTAKSVPGPGRDPRAVLRFIGDPYRFYDESVARYGRMFRVEIPARGTHVFLGTRELVEELYKMKAEHYGEGATSLAGLFGGSALVVISGQEHLTRRRLMVPMFKGEQMRSYGALMIECALSEVARWQTGQALDLIDVSPRLTMDVMVRALFGVRERARFVALTDAIREAADAFSALLYFLPGLRRDLGPLTSWGRFERAHKRISEIVNQEVAAALTRADDERVDILAQLARTPDQNGERLDAVKIKHELMGLLAAGHESTANFLTWTLYWVLSLPDVRARLLEEIAPIAIDDVVAVEKNRYLDAVVKEALRTCPPPEHYRRLGSALTMGGHTLAAGTVVTPSIYLVHRDPSLFPEPERFRPERYFEGNVGPYDWIPFGGGLRRCMGDSFSMYEIKMATFAFMKTWDLALLPGQELRPRRRRLNVEPAPHLYFVARRRWAEAPRAAASATVA